MKIILFILLMLVNTFSFADNNQKDIQLTADYYVINDVYFSDLKELKIFIQKDNNISLEVDYTTKSDTLMQFLGALKQIGVKKISLSTIDLDASQIK